MVEWNVVVHGRDSLDRRDRVSELVRWGWAEATKTNTIPVGGERRAGL